MSSSSAAATATAKAATKAARVYTAPKTAPKRPSAREVADFLSAYPRETVQLSRGVKRVRFSMAAKNAQKSERHRFVFPLSISPPARLDHVKVLRPFYFHNPDVAIEFVTRVEEKPDALVQEDAARERTIELKEREKEENAMPTREFVDVWFEDASSPYRIDITAQPVDAVISSLIALDESIASAQPSPIPLAEGPELWSYAWSQHQPDWAGTFAQRKDKLEAESKQAAAAAKAFIRDAAAAGEQQTPKDA